MTPNPAPQRSRLPARSPHVRAIGFGAFVAASASFALVAAVRSAEPVDFRKDVRPILVDKCFACHGTDATHREGGLRLDLREHALRGGDSKSAAIVPGHADRSELVRRIRSADPDLRMPPDKTKKPLTASERDILARWIEEGAEYRDHWAFVAPVRPRTPDVRRSGWERNEIDAFVLAKLEREGLAPAPEADRATWLRRVTLDVTGLPPTLAEIDAFLADTRPDAYERVVARLLDSPAYGERWGRIWLDGARYADSDGYEKDKPRFVWAYRDWVVEALNRDLPYDRFVVEQIAGDLLPGASEQNVVATGFLRNSMINEEGGIDPEQFRMEAMFDRMDAIGKSVLGLTVQCSQCHDHKYDPLSQQDYYRLFAFLNDTHEASVAVYTVDQQRMRTDVLRRIRAAEEDLRRTTPDWPARMARWEAAVGTDPTPWTVLVPEVDGSGGQKHLLLADGSVLAAGYAPTKHTAQLVVRPQQSGITAIRLELLDHLELPLGGPGRSVDGTCALTELKIETIDAAGKKTEVRIRTAEADVAPPETPLAARYDDKSKKHRITGPVAFAIDRKDETAWGIDVGPGRSNMPRSAVFVLEAPLDVPAGARLVFNLVQNHGGSNSNDNQTMNLGRFRFSATTAADPKIDVVPTAARRIFEVPAASRTPAQFAALFSIWRTTVKEWQAANDAIERIWQEHPRGESQLVLASRREPRTTFLLKRGDFLKPDRPVTPGVPSFLHPLRTSATSVSSAQVAATPVSATGPQRATADAPTRLDFANWLVDPRSPTTARAIVNRVWQGWFGEGLIRTSEDLGSQGELPSHPELLDWLAVEFVERGWSLKRLHRTIALSATYRQSSRIPEALRTRDPDNRLLARGPRFRLEAEGVRDVALAASGLLDPRRGGPSVCPPAPSFLFLPPASYGDKTWHEAEGSQKYRRALYTFRFRSVPYPALQVFDAPNADTACVRRVRSNTPLQALTTLNEPVFVDCARNLARLARTSGGSTDADRIEYAFRRATGRVPDEFERRTLAEFLAKQQSRFAGNEKQAAELAGIGAQSDAKWPAGVPVAQAAAWTALSRVLLNLDETITKE